MNEIRKGECDTYDIASTDKTMALGEESEELNPN